MQEDPEGPRFLIVPWSPGENRPTTRQVLHSDGFKISRAYSLTGALSSYAASGIVIKNKIFSDMADGESMTFEIQSVVSEDVVAWRRGYYDQPRSWEETGPEPGDQNSLTRRYAAQKQRVTPSMPKPRPSFLESCSTKALSLRRAATKKKRQGQQLRNEADSSSSDSSSTSSSNPDDASEST